MKQNDAGGFNPNQPRDPDGKFASGGGGGAGGGGRSGKGKGGSFEVEGGAWWETYSEPLEDFSEGEKYSPELKAKKIDSAKELFEYKMAKNERDFPGENVRSDPLFRNSALNSSARKYGLNANELAMLIPDSLDTFEFYDAVTVEHPKMTRDGFLVAEARVARTGIQLYRARELGLDGDPDRTIRVYRPPEEVFSADAMHSYAYRPVTVEHEGMIDAANWRRHARGQTGGEVVRDGEYVRVPLVLMDAEAINEWKQGKRELSMGYTMSLDMTDGITADGQEYDAVQRNLRMNHLALVSRARGGSQLRLGDSEPEETFMDVKLTTVVVDGLQVQTTDAGAAAISKLTRELADARTVAENAATKHAQDLSEKDRELAAKDAQLDALKEKVLDEAALDRMIMDRSDLIAKAKSIADKDYSGMNADDIRKTAVNARLGKNAIADKSPEYIQGRFDILAEDAAQDPVRRILRDGPQPVGDAADVAHSEMVNNLQNAWKGSKEVA